MGKYEEMKDDFLNDTKLMELLYKLYKDYTKMDLKLIKKVLKRDLWWESNECLKNGLVDEIWTGSKFNIDIKKEFSIDRFKTKETSKRKYSQITETKFTATAADTTVATAVTTKTTKANKATTLTEANDNNNKQKRSKQK